MRGCSGDQSGDSGDKQMAALQTNIIHLHWRCCHCPVQKYHFIEGSQWILIVTRWSQDNMCWYDPKPTNKRLLQRSTSLIHRFHNWGWGCIQGKVNNSLSNLMVTFVDTINLFAATGAILIHLAYRCQRWKFQIICQTWLGTYKKTNYQKKKRWFLVGSCKP